MTAPTDTAWMTPGTPCSVLGAFNEWHDATIATPPRFVEGLGLTVWVNVVSDRSDTRHPWRASRVRPREAA